MMNGTVTKPSVPSSFRRASCSQLVEGRLAEARRLGRRWRLRFQLPLGIAGVAIATVSIVGGWTTGKTALGGYGICGGPWLLLCCVLPTETRAIAAAIVCVSLCSATCAVYHALALGFILDGAAAATASAAGELCAPPRDASYGCASFRAISAYAVAILVVFTLLFIFLGVALYGSTSRSSWLPARPPRATLDSLWRLSGSVLIAYACVWIAFGIVELREPIYDLNIFSAREAEYSVADRVAIRFSLAFEMLVLSVLALWPGMRGFVQSRFAARGEGIVAAAGISELIGSCPTAELLARAERTFRSVRLDQLERHHLDSNKPAIEAYAISTRTALGSIDVRAHRTARPPTRPRITADDPRERCRELTWSACAPPPLGACGRCSAGLPLALVARRPDRKVVPAPGLARPLRPRARPRAHDMVRPLLPRPHRPQRAAAVLAHLPRGLRYAARAARVDIPQPLMVWPRASCARPPPFVARGARVQ
jgi:hypothetical protein